MVMTGLYSADRKQSHVQQSHYYPLLSHLYLSTEEQAAHHFFQCVQTRSTMLISKDLAALASINKRITSHMCCGRRTFATTITLSNGVPIETVSRMLGHSSLRTTAIYAKVVDTKISEDMRKVRAKLELKPKNVVVI